MSKKTTMKRDLFTAVEKIKDFQKKSSNKITKLAFLLFTFCCFISTAYSGSLSTNDIILLQFNSDGGDDELVFLPLVDLPAGEVIYFSDDNWSDITNSFATTEGTTTWTYTGNCLAVQLLKLVTLRM
jgi:hypothetical protein